MEPSLKAHANRFSTQNFTQVEINVSAQYPTATKNSQKLKMVEPRLSICLIPQLNQCNVKV
jgi:hypothetical protein